jgi:hypothetical protein
MARAAAWAAIRSGKDNKPDQLTNTNLKIYHHRG